MGRVIVCAIVVLFVTFCATVVTFHVTLTLEELPPRISVVVPAIFSPVITLRVLVVGISTDPELVVKTSPLQKLFVFVTSATHAPLSFLYLGPQSHEHTPPDQHQLEVSGATHASHPRFAAVQLAALRSPTPHFASEAAHGAHLPLDKTYPVMHTTAQLESYMLKSIFCAVHALHAVLAVALQGLDTLYPMGHDVHCKHVLSEASPHPPEY